MIAGDFQAIGVLCELRAHGAEIPGDQSDAVGLLDAEFLGVAEDDASGCERRDGSEDGELVDELRGEWAADDEGGGGRCDGG